MHVSAENVPGVERFVHLNDVDSTNTYARRLAAEGAIPHEGLIVIQADRQSAGRGRQGRAFFSSIRGGLWVSLIAAVDSLDHHFSVNRALSLAICDTVLAATRRAAFIKWPNDIVCSNRKICGILLESVESRDNLIIAGFGLNVNIEADQFPPDIAPIATSMRIEAGVTFKLDAILADIIGDFLQYRRTPGTDAHRAYEQRLHRTGDRIVCREREGIFEGVEPDGRMRMRTGSGVLYFTSGTIRFI